MNRNLLSHLSYILLFILFSFGNANRLKAQLSDTTVYDFNQSGGGSCSICGSGYNCFTSNTQSLTGNGTNMRLKSIKVIVYHTACSANNFYAIMNGTDTLGSFYSTYNCNCNTCFTDTIIAPANKANSYNYTGSNSMYFGGNYLCVDKIKVIRYYSFNSFNDAGVNKLDSPYFACPGAKNIVVTVANFGKNIIDSVDVNWTYNGVTQTTYKLSTTLDTAGGTGSTKATITLGNKTLTKNKKDTLVVWTSNPNGVSDTTNTNDTLRVFVAPSLSDTLTVGGSSPDYATVQGAITALQTQGICKSVVVNIRPGSYNEQLSIGKIPGADSLNTVTFRSSTGDSSDVTIYYTSSSSTNNYTLLLNSSQDIHFKQLTLEAQGTSYGKVIEIRGTFLRYSFMNCVINGISTTSTSSNYILVSNGVLANSVNRGITFNKCNFMYGSSGFLWNSSISASGLTMTNNTFSGQYYTNLYINYFKNINIRNNELLRNGGSYSSGYGIYMEYPQNVKITNNKIIQSNGASAGVYNYNITGSSNNRNLVANNFISVGNTNNVAAYGWMCYYSAYTDFYNNSVYTNTANTGYSSVYVYYGNNIRIRNNSIHQAADGNIIYNYSSSNNIEKWDNNNYFSSSPNSKFYYQNIYYTTLSDYQSGTGLDSFSSWGNPNYKSSSDLHAYSSDLNGNATPDSRITTDIDGQTRNSSTPDIGADEFALAPTDAGISNILTFKADSVCVQAVLRNNGADTLKTVQIGWSINGTSQSAYSWSGTLLSGKNTTVCVGKYKFNDSTNYTVKSWTSQPNSLSDTINFNDTFQRIGKPAMSGIYTIGGSNPDYSTFTAAISAMISRGILDSVKFKVRNGTYNEHLDIPKITGAGPLNSIIFESENKNSALVTLSYATDYSYYEVVNLDAVTGVTFRKITIKSTGSSPSRAVTLTNGASNIELSGNKLESASGNSTDNSNNSVIYANNPGRKIRIINNTILNGATAIYLYQNSEVTIEGNSLLNAYYMGISVDDVTNLILNKNTISSTSDYSGYYGAYFNNLYGTNTISNNRISGPNKSEYAGLYIDYINVSSSSDSTYIFNNFISCGGNNSSYAAYIYYCENTHIAHNNFYLYGTSSGTTYATYLRNLYGSFCYNNNFINANNGYALLTRSVSNTLNDYNNYYTNGSYLTSQQYTDYATLADMLANGIDSNSINIDPNFASSTDLHVQNIQLDSAAKKLHFAATDIDGETRNSVRPDIGADEFTPAERDAGVIAFLSPKDIISADTTSIRVAVRNLGIDTLFSFKVKCRINSDTMPMLSYNDTLLPGDSVHLTLGNYVFRRDSINNLTAYTILPNGGSDQKTLNDTFRIMNRRTAMSGVYTIGGSSPDFPSFKTAVKAMYDNGISGSVRFRVRAGTYSEQLLFTPIPGAGSRNSVVFESENLDSTSVTLQYNSSYYDSNYVVYFNGGSGITFRNLTIKALSSSYPLVFLYENKAQYNTLNNNYIKGYTSTSTDNRKSIIGSFNGSYGDEYNEFHNNLIEGGSYGMYWYGYGAPNYNERGTIITSNTFINQYNSGIYLYYQNSAEIHRNTFSSSNTYAYYYGIGGIYLNYKTRITGNQLNLIGRSGYGIYLESCNGNGDTILVASNIIQMGGNTNSVYSIYGYYNYYTHYVNNTIKTEANSSSSSYGLYMYYGNYNQLHNNIVENAGPGYVFYVPSSSAINKSDRNNFRTAGSSLGYWGGNYYSTIAALYSATGNDSNSLSLDPQFFGSTNLHVKQIGFNGKASPHPLVKTDVDGQLRNTTKPDIGADEFNPPARDVAVEEFLNPKNAIKADSMMIKILVRNLGLDTLKSFKVGCRINRDSLVTITVNRTLPAGDSIHVSIGKYRFRRDSINNLTAWSFNPNNSTDLNTINDTVRIKNMRTAMSGDYTIGGSSPDFPTFKAAIKGMQDLGILDYVRFKVRAGAYTEQLRIPAISGAGAPNSIIFESESLDSTSVVVQYNSTFYDTNYVVFLNGASGATFRKMRFRALNASYSTVFLFESNADNNALSNNIIQGSSSSSTSTYNSVIASYNSTYSDDQNSFTNNIIEGGSYGIYWYGSGAPTYYENKTLIRNNEFRNQYYMGISLYYQTNLEVDRNTFSTSSSYSYFYPVYCNYVNNKSRFTSNKINTGNAGGYGIYLYGCNGSGDSILIANNMISTGGTNGNNNIYLYSSSYVHTVNNTLKLSSATSNSAANISVYSGNYNHILNNIMENESTGYCMDIQTPSSVVKSNRNNFRTLGSNIVKWNGTGYPTINTLKAVSLKDSNSLTLDPLFYGATDLHIRQIGLNGKGSRHPLVKRDIDNQERSITPDIGADEFTPPALDAGIFSILTPKTPFLKDSQFVAVVLKNYGLNTLNSVKIDWKLNNNSLATYNWSGSLGSNDTIHVRLAKSFFNRDSAYSLKVWSYLPNSYNDTVNYNDTAKAINQYPALSGIYTIGGASPDFNTFTDAIDAMIRGGVVGNVTFNVRNGTYSEKLTIPRIIGADKHNSIIFQSENLDSTKVTLINSYNTSGYNYTIRLQGAVGVTFKHMTISATNTSYGIVASILEGSSYNTFTNNILEGISTTSTSTEYALIHSNITNNTNNSYNQYTNNVFKNGSYGIYAYGYASGLYDKKIVIHNNIFQTPYYTGLYLMYNDSATITANKLTIGTYSSAFGIRMEYCNGGYNLSGNSVVVPNGYMGIYLYSSSGLSTKYSLVSNNMISVLGNGNNYGLYANYVNYVNYYNNSFHINSTSTSSYAAQIYGSPVRSVNNIFDHTGAGYAFYNNSSSFSESNYNCYRANGTNLAYWNGNRTNLSALKAANSMDANSITTDPKFVSESDLHIRAISLDKAGKVLSDVKFDFDRTKRDSLKPDIGADEFQIPSPNDAGISAFAGPLPAFSPGSNSVKVILNNYGSDTLKSAIIKWKMNGSTQTSYSWTGKIATGDAATITIGSYSFSTGVKYTLEVWTALPNSVDDTIFYNDTLKKTNIYSGLDGTYTIGGYLPDFKTFAEANTALMQRGVIDTVRFEVRNGTYEEQLEIVPYPGSSRSRPVTFASESGDSSKVILKYQNTTDKNFFLIHLKGADNLTFSRMTLRAYDNSYYNHVVVIDNEAKNNTVMNNRIIAEPSWYRYYYGYGYYSTGVVSGSDKDDSIRIISNYISGDNGITLTGVGTNTNQQETGMVIEGNKVDKFISVGIQITYQNSPVIRRNDVFPDINYGASMINAINCFDNMVISHNKLYGSHVYNTGIAVNSFQGISSKKGNIFNNFISLKNPTNNGINISSSAYCNLSFNSVNLYGTGHANATALQLTSSSSIELRNNILCNNSGGYAIRCDNAPSISNYNDLFTVGTNLGRVSTTNYTSLTAWKAATSKDANSKSVDPIFFSETDLHTTLTNLDSAATPVSGITDDIDRNTRNASKPDIGADEFNSLPNNLSITAILNPVSGCLIDSQQLVVTIFNYGSYPQKNFPVRYRINGGAVTTQTFTDSIYPGNSKNFSFNGKVDTKTTATYNFNVWTDLSTEQYRLNDTIKAAIRNYSIPDSVTTMSPNDSIKNLYYPLSLSWAPSTDATLYDVYIWPDSVTNRPSTPAYSGLSQIGIQINSGLGYGTSYKWQIYARNPSCGQFGKVSHFSIRELPDLNVSAISSPSTAFSGTNVSVSWSVKNIGKGSTGTSSWYDLVYFSNDQILDVLDPLLTGVVNATALNAGKSYSNSASVTLPNGIVGKYYIIVKTEAYDQFIESNEGNNISTDTSGMVVSLTPPPDLQVISVIKPGTAFSGQTINIQYTVKNKGTGITVGSNWSDQIYLNKDSAMGGTLMRSISHNGALDVDSTYKVNTTITLPFNLSGAHYIIARTDVNNNIFEHAGENNNHRISDSIKIIQTPPPDLIVRNIRIKDSSSNRETVNLTYDLINQGGSTTTTNWTDNVYFSRFSTFNTSTATLLASYGRSNIKSDDTLVASQNIVIPDNLNGLFYMYIMTDAYNQQFEGTKDTNNLSPRKTFVITTPDLIVSSVQVPAEDTSGQMIKVDWVVKNKGLGKNLFSLRQDKIYISRYSNYHKDSLILLDSVSYYSSLNPTDSIIKTRNVRIPDGTYGYRYIYVYTDIPSQVYENALDTNNYRRSDRIDVKLAPYPDLRTIAMQVPDTSEAGTFINVGYTVDNKGNKDAKASWSDKVYISKDSVFNPNKVVLLQTNIITSDLMIDSSYQMNQTFKMQDYISAGNYYFFIYTDATDVLYEFQSEKNNIKRSSKVYVNGYPPIDLTVTKSSIPDSIYSGSAGQFGYTVKNIGEAKTWSGAWADNVYLSVDTFLDASDKSIGEVPVYTTLEKDSTYVRNLSFLAPNGFSGNYYVFFKTDWKRDNVDDDTLNNAQVARDINGKPKKMKVILSKSADLRITAWDIPSTAIAGQPVTLSWKTENKGDTTTKSGSWVDAVYLSTDYTIDAGDHYLGSLGHSGNMKKNTFYEAGGNYFLPSNLIGSYIVIIKTDNNNREYEHMAENNNTGASAMKISIAPPGDLVVTTVNGPSNAAAGSNVTVSYSIKNIGANPISGYRTDNIYLSADNDLDASDVLFASITESASMIPNSSRSLSASGSVKGVKTGNYYFIVFTDVKNNINESKDTNNTNASDIIDISIPELKMKTLTKDTLIKNKELYYRLIIPDSLEGESFIVTMKGDSINGINELYARFDEAPTRAEFDFGYSTPFYGNQELIIPKAKVGTYYLMAYGKTTTSIKQNITLYARKMEFEIRKVNPKIGGNNGQVTMRIDGSKFDENTTFLLGGQATPAIDPSIQMPDSTLHIIPYKQGKAHSTTIINPTLAYVTFNLRGYTPGVYDVIASKDDGNTTTRLIKGFTVVTGTPPDIEVSVSAPSSTRANTLTSFQVMFGNYGTTDYVNGYLEIVSNTGAPVSLTIGGITGRSSSVFIPLEEYGGIKGLLKPGGVGTITVYTFSNTALAFNIILPQ